MVYDLETKGYLVCYDAEIVSTPYMSVDDMWARAMSLCGGVPDLVVGIIPLGMIPPFLDICNRFRVPLIRPKMKNISRGAEPVYEWRGEWVQTVRLVMEEVQW